MNKKIKVETGVVPKMVKLFGVSKVSIYKALNYKTNTDLAERIRQYALNVGGEIWEKNI